MEKKLNVTYSNFDPTTGISTVRIDTKIGINMHAVEQVERSIEKHKPPKGIVQIMSVTERQFAGMKLVVGELDDTFIQDDKRMIVL